jgi:hypothetical protein
LTKLFAFLSHFGSEWHLQDSDRWRESSRQHPDIYLHFARSIQTVDRVISYVECEKYSYSKEMYSIDEESVERLDRESSGRMDSGGVSNSIPCGRAHRPGHRVFRLTVKISDLAMREIMQSETILTFALGDVHEVLYYVIKFLNSPQNVKKLAAIICQK